MGVPKHEKYKDKTYHCKKDEYPMVEMTNSELSLIILKKPVFKRDTINIEHFTKSGSIIIFLPNQ